MAQQYAQMMMYYQRYAPYVLKYMNMVWQKQVECFNWVLFRLTGKKNIQEVYQVIMDRFERFLVDRASKYAYDDYQGKGQDIRRGISQN